MLVGAGGSLAFDHATATWEPDQTARKFEFGARHWPLYPAMAAGLAFLERVGLDAIQARSGALVEQLRQDLAGVPGVVDVTPTDPAMRTGIVAAAVEGMDGTELRDRLREQGFLLRANRGPDGLTGVRICCAFFNSEDEIARVAAAVRALASAHR